MQSQKLAGIKPGPSTKKYLDIAEIKEDCVVLRDGTLRAVLMVSSINFALKSEEEQQALVSAYVQFLNFLDFPLQIIIQSRKLNIEGYINQLSEAERSQTNELLKLQIADYRQFIKELVELQDIMTKRFYVVVPFDPASKKHKSFFSRLKEVIVPALSLRLQEERFRSRKQDLLRRVDHIVSQLEAMGLKCVLLDTQGLIELYYNTYNPVMAETEKLAGLNEIQVE